jgi:hypothetical protein
VSSRFRSLGRIVVVGLLVAVSSAQATGVPAGSSDGYRPPVCAVASTTAAQTATNPIATAEAEQREGERDPKAIPSVEPMENFALARYRLAEYGECEGDNGCYWADLDAQYQRAEGALRVELARRKPGEKLAVVMDIDETTLTNWCEMKREDFGYIGSLYRVWETSPASATSIPGALRLFGEAQAAGAAVFFITGRPGVPRAAGAKTGEDETAATARNLRAAGFDGWAGLALRSGAENGMPTIRYKAGERAKIVAKGYTIALSVGDQWSDLLGDPQADVSVKLPNPFYFLP